MTMQEFLQALDAATLLADPIIRLALVALVVAGFAVAGVGWSADRAS